MKYFSLFATLGLLCAVSLGADAPVVDHRADELGKKIKEDVSSGKVSKIDGDQLQHELDRIERVEEQASRGGKITNRTRADLKRDLDKLENDIARKEKKTAAMGSPSPSKP